MYKSEFLAECWHYYLTLENEVIKTFRYVSLIENNYQVQSIEFQRLLLSIGSEFEIELKKYIDMTTGNIITWHEKIVNDKMMNRDNTVRIIYPSTIAPVSPFNNWEKNLDSDSPCWWKDYNDVKHDRLNQGNKANLENVLNSLAGLYLVLQYQFYKINDIPGEILRPSSKLFLIDWATEHFIIRDARDMATLF